MMFRQALLAAACLAGAFATPTAASANDARLVNHRYNDAEVVRIAGKLGVQASIAFAESEHIENVAIGDSTSWQVTPNKRANLLFVKPLNASARTNMTVVTDRRTYFFDLVASPSSSPLYILRFTYPAEATPPAGQQTAALSGTEQQAIEEKPVDPAQLNFAWRSKGSQQLLPARIYDDGDLTYMSWPIGAPVPAMLVRDEKGVEGPVNYAVRGDVIVVEGVPRLIVLRHGKASATLENAGPIRPAALPQAAVPQAEVPPASLAAAPPATLPAADLPPAKAE